MGLSTNRTIGLWCFLAVGWLFSIGTTFGFGASAIAHEDIPEGRTTSSGILTENLQATMTLAMGWRYDRLDWSVAGNSAGSDPNILSELDWHSVHSRQLAFSSRFMISPWFYGRGSVSYAWIHSGQVRDSDYAGDNRTFEYSRSVSETNGDQLWDISLSGGRPFSFWQDRLFWAPLVGFSLHRQNLRITNGLQVIGSPPRSPAPGPLDNRLNSIYMARWVGPWAGMDLRWRLGSPTLRHLPMEVGLSLEYHFWTDYLAEADWNLRGDLRHPTSFEHQATGQGVLMQFEWLIRPVKRLDISLGLNFQRWETGSGTDRIFLSNGTVEVSHFNAVHWESSAVMFGMTYHFF